jgi:predicted RNase H-like nuclease (RuvC/YqgF family)
LFFSNYSLKFVAKKQKVMSASEKTINTFATRVRQMILKFEDIKHENAELYAMVDERDAKIKELQEKLTQAKHDYDSLKMAKMMTISDSDMETTQKRIAKLIRDVNKCITLLSDK